MWKLCFCVHSTLAHQPQHLLMSFLPQGQVSIKYSSPTSVSAWATVLNMCCSHWSYRHMYMCTCMWPIGIHSGKWHVCVPWTHCSTCGSRWTPQHIQRHWKWISCKGWPHTCMVNKNVPLPQSSHIIDRQYTEESSYKYYRLYIKLCWAVDFFLHY